ncbi:MAG: ATP-binding protein [Salinivirgaceae bacterium]|nr:ATP-binding protein [Salinivirgaceae bacterium]
MNAIKFTNANGEINLLVVPNSKFVEITISDNGIGMTNEAIQKLLKEDAILTTLGTHNEKGLGLTVCKEFVELHGGISIESELDKGSAFKFTLPIL